MPVSASKAMALGHLALHYKTLEDAPRAAKLLALLGFEQMQEVSLGAGVSFYQFTVARDPSGRGIGTIYLSMLPRPLAEIMAVVRRALKVGAADEHPSVAALRAAQAQDPEMNFHVGVMVDSLEEIERVMLKLREANEGDPDLKGRLNLICNKARPGDEEIDARMAASPVFSSTLRETYGRYGCQAFVETDLLAGGPLGDNLVIELDYAFPGHVDNMFVKVLI